MKKDTLIKIIIPVIIFAVVGMIWMLKNTPDKQEQSNAPIAQNNIAPNKGNDATNDEKSDEPVNPDFVLEVNEIDLEKLKSYGLPIYIQFGADSCAPCKAMAPIVEKLNKEFQGKVIIKFVDVWENQDAAKDYPVEVIPTQVFFDKDGNPYVPSDPERMQMRMYTRRDTNEHVFTTHQGGMTEEQLLEVFKEMGVNR